MVLSDTQKSEIAQVFQDRFLAGERFATITQARRLASDVLGEKVQGGTKLAKATEESIEQGLVGAAQSIMRQGQAESRSPTETFEQLVDLYERQPRLGSRSSTSVLRQQYSTPVPIAQLASELAGIDDSTEVYEPTAGHGALLMGVNPDKATVNELDDDRAAFLRQQGFQVTQNDATEYAPEPRSQDVVITNPPFGRRRKDGRAERFQIGAEQTPIETSQLDHVIAWRSLEAMKDDGTAVLLIGSERGSERSRSDKYNEQQNRGFFKNLYDNYNVTDHFTIDGGLYSRQGAGFPIDVIRIQGRGPSQRRLPAADVPDVYSSYDELKEVLANAVLRQSPSVGAEPGNRERDDPNQAGQLLRSPRPGGQDADRELRGLQGAARQADRMDDPGMDGSRSSDAAGGRPDDSSAVVGRQRTGNANAQPGGSDPSELGGSAGRQPMDEHDLDLRDNARKLSAADGAGRSEGGYRDHDRGAEPRGLASVLQQNGQLVSAEEEPMSTAEQTSKLPSQVRYMPKSKGPQLETLIPRNMASAVQGALDKLEGRVGDVDEFVAQKLNYPSVETMHEVLAAEQVDGVALGIDSIEHGDGALVGDQTGVGKGRQAAAMIRYAKETDRTPVFITRDAGLYADMIRDLDDIGVNDFKPFITNSKEKVPLPDGRTLETKPKSHAAELDRLLQQGGFGAEDDYDGVFTTYSQMQTVRGKNTPRREFLDAIAPQSLVVMDEAHEAGGSPQNERAQSGPPNRAEFARGLVDKADGVTFASATAVKRPDVMDLYGRRSGMREALGTVEALQETLETGGIPLQQTATNMLAQDGFYIRRERTYEGVDFGIKTVEVDRASTDNLSQIMGGILKFDRAKQDVLDALDDQLKAAAKKVGIDNTIGRAGADSVNFTALMHNVMDQSALGRKAEQMADEAIASLEQGEKPILTVSNTMGSFIESYVEDNDLSPGDAFDAKFGDVLMRYLERSRDVMEKDYDGSSTRRRLSDEELGPEAVQEYEAAKELIETTDLDFPVSPIDYIKQRVEEAGYNFGEITGRQARLSYDSEGNTTYERRSSRETSKAGKVKATDNFNSGKTDVLLINRSGATGISLHASEKFADQRRRHMIVGQAERNINDFMQTLGRAHRTGQVVPPRISLLMGDTPDEKRPAALLNNKMSSLNANTTADKNAGFDTSAIPDFFNQYGDAVVEQVLSEYPDINAKLDYPIKVDPDGVASLDEAEEGAISRVTGRLPLLTVDEQESFYEVLEAEYASFVEQQKALGNNVLEAEAVDLDARTLAQAEVIASKPGMRSTFGSGVTADVIDAKAQSKPKTQLEVVNEVRENLGLESVDAVADHDAEAIDERSQAYSSSLLAKAGQAADKYLQQRQTKIEQRIRDPEKQQTALHRESRRLGKQKDQLTQFNRLRVGQTVRLATEQGRIFYGAVSGINKRGRSLDDMIAASDDSPLGLGDTNPVAASQWQLNVSLADTSREVSLPLSKVNTDRMGSVEMMPVRKTMMGADVMEQFDTRQAGEREVRQVLRGNLLRAAEKYGKKGNVVNATTSDGEVEPMLLLPRGYDLQQELSEAPVELPAARNVKQFMDITNNEGIVKTSDEQITLKSMPHSDNYLLQTGKKQKNVFLDESLMEVMGGEEFYSVSDRMEASFPASRLEEVVTYIQDGRNQQLEAVTHLEQARELVGEKLPEFAWSDSVEDVIEDAGLPPSVDMSNVDTMRDRLNTLLQSEDEVTDEPELLTGDGEIAEAETESVDVDSVEPSATRIDAGGDESEAPESETPVGPESAQPSERWSLAEQVEAVKSSVEDGARPSFIVAMPGRGNRPPRQVRMAVTNPAQLRLSEEGDRAQIASATDLSRFFDAPDFETEAVEVLGLDSESAAAIAQDDADKSVRELMDELPVDPNRPIKIEPVSPESDVAEEPAYKFDSDGPTAVGRERARLLNNYSGADAVGSEQGVEEANAIAARDDELEALAEEHGEDARIDFTDPAEQETAIAAGDIRYPGQSGASEIAPDSDTFSVEQIFEARPDIFTEQPDSLMADLADAPEILYQDGERDFIRIDRQLYSYQNDALDEVRQSLAQDAEATVEPSVEVAQIGGWTEQQGKAEKHVGKLLEEAGLSEAVMADEDFYLKVENEPFIPLNIERHDEQLMLYHTLVEGGDAYIDSEMVFDLADDGTLALSETATQNPVFGESRGRDRSFAGMFASNLRKQGFAEAAREAIQQRNQEASVTETSERSLSETSEAAVEPVIEGAEGEPDEELQPLAETAADAADAVRQGLMEGQDTPIASDPSVVPPELLGEDAIVPPDDPQPFDYRETLESLREQADTLPEEQRENLLKAIQQTAKQLSGEPPSATQSDEEAVPAREFVQSAIAKQDPDLDEQLEAATPDDSPTVDAFRDWYRAARSLGRSEQGLKQIEMLGKAAKAGNLEGFDPAAKEQMDVDLDTFAEQAAIGQSVIGNARRFLHNLEEAGLAQRDEQGAIQAKGQIYTVRETQQGFGVIKNDQSAGVVADSDGQITQVAGLTEEDRANWQKSGAKTPDDLRAQSRLQQSYQQLATPARAGAGGIEL